MQNGHTHTRIKPCVTIPLTLSKHGLCLGRVGEIVECRLINDDVTIMNVRVWPFRVNRSCSMYMLEVKINFTGQFNNVSREDA